MDSKEIVVVNIPYDISNYNQSLGFSIRGGAENKMGIIVSKVDKGSFAEHQGLKYGDQIIEVNESSFKGIMSDEALVRLTEERDLVIIVSRSYKSHQIKPRGDQSTFTTMNNRQDKQQKIYLVKSDGNNLGFSIRGGSEYGTGIFISKVSVGGLSDSMGLRPGQQIIEVNGHSFVNISHQEAASILQRYSSLVIAVINPRTVPTFKDIAQVSQSSKRSGRSYDATNISSNTTRPSPYENGNDCIKERCLNDRMENHSDIEFPIPPPPLETAMYDNHYTTTKPSPGGASSDGQVNLNSARSLNKDTFSYISSQSHVDKFPVHRYTNGSNVILDVDNSTKKHAGLKSKFFRNKKSYDFLPTFNPSPGALSPNKASTDSPKRSKRYADKPSIKSSFSESLSNFSSTTLDSGARNSYSHETARSSTPRSMTSSSYDSNRVSLASHINVDASEAIIYLLMKKLMKRRDRHKLQDKIRHYLRFESSRIEDLALLALDLLNRTEHLIIVKELRNIIRDRDRTMFDLLISPSEQAVEEILSAKQKEINKSPNKKMKTSLSMEFKRKLSSSQTIGSTSSISNLKNTNTYLDENDIGNNCYWGKKPEKSVPFFNKYGSLDTLNKIAKRSKSKDVDIHGEEKKTVRIMAQHRVKDAALNFHS